MPKTILLTGATGNISSGIIGQLKGSPHKLLALVRDPDKAKGLEQDGVEIRVGDLEKPWTLGAAFKGADTVWILTPPGPRAPEQSSNALWAAKNAGAKHVVRMSAFGAQYNAPTINSRLHALADAELIAAEIPYTIVKPHYFMQNLLWTTQSIVQQDAMYLPLADCRMGLIDLRDIAEFAAQVLTTDGHEGKTYTITGPASVTMHQVAAAISEAIGRSVRYEPIAIEVAQQSMLQMGMDEWMANLLRDYYAVYSTNWGDLVTDDFQRVVGKPSRSISQFARDFASAFAKQ